ncbi:hypothetical protein R7892_05760 [Ligilactobacillus murinus]|uniref:hypothetical protein n=1 Tax=Ligilactobacillus murinus TaxID=1622 RepID=UPI00296AB15D|nr:hypothetical protein [Ligilactobacillus murinus]WOY88203.1 hypothetical protein R7892_05760 [Ligilactobacillus murinus]
MKLSEKIKWLIFDSGITTYRIAKEIGENVQTLDYYKKDSNKIEGMSLKRAEKLEEFINQHITEEELVKSMQDKK